VCLARTQGASGLSCVKPFQIIIVTKPDRIAPLGCSDTASSYTVHSETAGLADFTALRETQLI
jgi:hypothetical protein